MGGARRAVRRRIHPAGPVHAVRRGGCGGVPRGVRNGALGTRQQDPHQEPGAGLMTRRSAIQAAQPHSAPPRTHHNRTTWEMVVMFASSRSLLATAGVCALALGVVPHAADAQSAQAAGPVTARTAPSAHPAFPVRPVARTLHGTIRQLGTLGGASSEVTDVDDQVVVGSADTADQETHAFVYDLGAAAPSMVDLGTLGGSFSGASAVSG